MTVHTALDALGVALAPAWLLDELRAGNVPTAQREGGYGVWTVAFGPFREWYEHEIATKPRRRPRGRVRA